MNCAEIRHFHLFAGLGGGARGFNQGEARVGSLRARFRCLGGVDVDPAAMRDFAKLAGVPGTCLDLFDREQFKAFHDQEPPASWREATPDDIRRAAGGEVPHIVFLSAPCKGFSGLLSESRSKTGKYQALNRLTLRGVWLMLEAWADDLPELIIFENVPRIATRGRHLLDQINVLLRSYGYAVAETTHDCGELGGLAQSRKRFLLVARNPQKVPAYLYEPKKRPLKSVGSVLETLPLPGDPLAGPMHRLPALQWKTWVRLAFVEAGGDWRSLARLRVVDGKLADFGIQPLDTWNRPGKIDDPRSQVQLRNSALGVLSFGAQAGTVTSRAFPYNGGFTVADPRFKGHEFGQYGVRAWGQGIGTVSGQSAPGGGSYSVADPRVKGVRHNNIFRVVRFGETSPSVTGGGGPSAGGLAVADPRMPWTPDRENYKSGGHFGVIPWTASSGAVSAAACADNGRWSVADPRLPDPGQNLVAVIQSLDDTWHRPFTTMELAALQGLVDPQEQFELDGLSDMHWRERIGNAVPPPAARAIAGVMGQVLLLTWGGETFHMGNTPIWVQPVAAALMAAQ